ncbi:acylsugar acyltransferase 3-like [Cynara cardunculus var. scolymus]|uniref:acylsugar acyltransferase 3-like n=1 Tax=Cynara cardunculus var. scolymus TaxID=59895 RepID=UPI000D62F7F8|nr:acylsugar acyltransferase 3-like [Cynara cardunculus var. scolymus]
MEIISKEIIKPSSPTPHHLRTFKLSLLDQLTLHTYAPIILLYESRIITSTSIDVFKKSLAETLTKYYPFAGRLRDDGITVDCNDEGVVLVQAKLVDHKLSDFLQNPSYETQRLLFPEGFLWKGSCIGYAFLAAQVTYFSGGGMAVTVSLSHKVADAPSLGIFLSDWAAVARGEVRPPPLILATSIPSLDLAYTMPEIVIEMSEACVTKRFVFDAGMISRLRLSVIGFVENPTKIGLVTALLYRCAIAASTAKTGGFRNSTLIQLVNMRQRLAAPLPENSVGNFTWYFTTSNHRESETSLGNLVVQLKKGIKELLDNRDNLRLENWLTSVRESAYNVKELFDNIDVYRCSHVRGGSFYQMDFGWGNPKWATIADVLVKNAFVLYDTPDGDGVEAVVSLEEEHMRLFQSNEELAHFASFTRSRI